MTIPLVASTFFGGQIEKTRRFLYEYGYMPNMISKSHLNRRLHRIEPTLWRVLFELLAQAFKERNNSELQTYAVDSLPIPVCDNIRIARCRLAQGELWRGYSASKRRYFYGLKVQVVVTVEGVPVECCILPGSLSDIQGLAELPLSLPAGAQVAADSAYTFYEWEDHLVERDSVHLLVARKANSKRRDTPPVHDYKQWLRRRVETIFGEIAKLFPKKIHATTLSGFVLKISLFLFAYQVDKAFIH